MKAEPFAGLILAFRQQQHLADAEQAHGHDGDAEAVAQVRDVEDEALLAGDQIDADGAAEQAEADHREGLRLGAFADAEDQHQAEQEQRGLLHRPEHQGDACHPGPEPGDADGGDDAGEERRRAR